MKTIHTKSKAKNLMKKIYKACLLKDRTFHFFYEPELIIRTNKVMQVRKYLKKNNIKYRIYSYPVARGEVETYYDETSKLILDNLKLFNQLYHLHSIVALTFSNKKKKEYLNRAIHTAFNPAGYGHTTEGEYCVSYGIRRMILPTKLLAMENRDEFDEVIDLLARLYE